MSQLSNIIPLVSYFTLKASRNSGRASVVPTIIIIIMIDTNHNFFVISHHLYLTITLSCNFSFFLILQFLIFSYLAISHFFLSCNFSFFLILQFLIFSYLDLLNYY